MINLSLVARTFFFLAGSVGLSFQIASQNSANDTSVLLEPVQSFQIQKSPMEAALRSLREKDFARILIGFEEVARPRGERPGLLSLSLANATVGQILDQLCQKSGEYTYELIDDTLIHVYPIRAQSDPPGLLDLRISEFSVKGNMLPAAVIVRIPSLAPELAVICPLASRTASYDG